MLIEISEKSKQDYKNACAKLGRTDALPIVDHLPADEALYHTANHMLIRLIEARKNGVVNDITNHDVLKYEPLFTAKSGYEAGSGSGGFSFLGGSIYDRSFSSVGARHASNSRADAREIAEAYPDLYEIVILNVK